MIGENDGFGRSKVPIELTHGSICSDVRKLQSMDVLQLQSTKADWNKKGPFHILASTVIYWLFQPVTSSKYCLNEKYCLIGLTWILKEQKYTPFIWISWVKE